MLEVFDDAYVEMIYFHFKIRNGMDPLLHIVVSPLAIYEAILLRQHYFKRWIEKQKSKIWVNLRLAILSGTETACSTKSSHYTNDK